MDYRTLPGATLAYLGDAVFETLVRRRLIDEGQTRTGQMNKLALSFVKATAQSAAAERILPHLTEEEGDVFRRGRNASGLSVPKSADAAAYRRATGFEALFGWLALRGEDARAKELFDLAFPRDGVPQ